MGYRSPRNPQAVLSSTVQTIRLQLRIFRRPNKSKIRLIPGYLTIPQLAKALDLPLYWFYDRIRKGQIQIEKDQETDLYLFPDHPETLKQFQMFKSGIYKKLRF